MVIKNHVDLYSLTCEDVLIFKKTCKEVYNLIFVFTVLITARNILYLERQATHVMKNILLII